MAINKKEPHRPAFGDAELVSANWIAALIGRCTKYVHRLDIAASMPKPVFADRSKRWRRIDVLAWLDNDCPNRAEFDKLKVGRATTKP